MNDFGGLFRSNPMILETRRMWRRFFRGSGSTSVNKAAMILAGLTFLIFMVSVWNSRASIPPISIVIVQTAVLLLVVPSISHGAFAGERERRSWDLLLVAPLRKSQILVGKFVACLAAIGATALFFLLPFLITMLSYSPFNLGDDLLAELVSLSFAVLLCAVSFAISARSKRAFAALGSTIGLLVFALGFLPVLILAISTGAGEMRGSLLKPHPFVILESLYARVENSDSTRLSVSPGLALGFCFIYLLLAAALLFWTDRTLESEDGDGRFTARRKHA
jgi:ABC-type transport system involved in multi-copper enzyme maturation permease subunit